MSSGAGRSAEKGKSRRQQPAAFLNSGASGRPRRALFATLSDFIAVARRRRRTRASRDAAGHRSHDDRGSHRLAFAKARKHDEAMLLTVIEALVERRSRVSEFLERSSTLPMTFARRLSRSIGSFGRSALARAAIVPIALCEIAQRALHCRPVLFLLCGEF